MKIILKLLYFLLDLIVPKINSYVFSSKGGLCAEQNVLSIYNFYKNQGEICILLKNPNSLKELWISLRAKTVFMTHGPGDIPLAMHSFRKNVVYLGHGITIKKMLFADRGLTLKRRILSGVESRFYSHIIASSESDQANLAKVFSLNKKGVYITGLPRVDRLNTTNQKLKDFFAKEGEYFLYAPTYRDYAPTKFFPFDDFDLQKLNDHLIENNKYLVIRSHPNETGMNSAFFDYSNMMNGNLLPSIQDYLADFTGVITDYSSIYIDFLMTNKKVAFIPYDLKKYEKSTGLFYDYDEVTPGPHVSNQKELIEFFLEDQNKNQVQRQKVKDIFFKYQDFESCQRIYNLFH